MAFNKYILRITVRLVLIFTAMLALTLIIGQQARLFSVISVSLILLLLVLELFRTISRTNRIVGSLLESIRFGDYNRKIQERAADLGFESLADSAQEIIRAIASAKIEKETQYLYLQMILDHIHTAVITLDQKDRPEMVNPLALHILGLYNNRNPTWEEIGRAAPAFAETVQSLGDSGRQMIRLSNTPSGKQVLILVNSVRIGEEPVRIITFQDIEPEIDQKEMESWQTISRIMAHEIMNSLTPLSSLTETGIMLLEKEGKPRKKEEISQQTLENLHTALKTISDRNRTLTQFIGNYRQLSRLPQPDRKVIRVSDLLGEIAELYGPQFERRSMGFSVSPGAGKHSILADEAQVKQVLINLVKNGMEALEECSEPMLQIGVKRVLDHMVIEVSDNGPGIPNDILEKIFIPFYTTKPEGSGIGLSLCRQIIRNHGGQVNVKSETGKGTTFTVSFPVE
jgi:nitrogen fixation/metabolism regulation signal transduction histidine kinase